MPDLFGIFERLARRIAQPSSGTGQDAPLDHPPITVFENYIKGLLAETPSCRRQCAYRDSVVAACVGEPATLSRGDAQSRDRDGVCTRQHTIARLAPQRARTRGLRRARSAAHCAEAYALCTSAWKHRQSSGEQPLDVVLEDVIGGDRAGAS